MSGKEFFKLIKEKSGDLRMHQLCGPLSEIYDGLLGIHEMENTPDASRKTLEVSKIFAVLNERMRRFAKGIYTTLKGGASKFPSLGSTYPARLATDTPGQEQ